MNKSILRISANDNREQTINLLMISNDKTNRYSWIKNISRLLAKQTSNRNGARFHCERCLNSLCNKDSLEKHLEYCKNYDAVTITSPKRVLS